MRIGSLFSGAAGLDRAVEAVFGGTVAWFSEVDPAASKVLAHHFPNVPNLGSVTEIDWATVPPVDVICGGFPCTDVSAAGKRAGMHGTRSGLWSHMAEAIDVLRPRYVLIENVRGLLNANANRPMESTEDDLGDGSGGPVLRAIGAVLGDLADIGGYEARWVTLAAAAVGAPHRRERVFILASATDAAPFRRQGGRQRDRMVTAFARFGSDVVPHGDAPNTPRDGRNQGRPEPARLIGGSDVELLPTPAACNPNDGEGVETWLARREVVKARVGNDNGMGMPLTIAVQLLPGDGAVDLLDAVTHHFPALLPTPGAADCTGGGANPERREAGGHHVQLIDEVLSSEARWGKYAPAIARWEAVLGRPAPAPTEPNRNGNPRLSAAFSEWLMGWPAGWVTDPAIGISRNDQLRCVGNGVVTLQAIAALRYLLSVAEVAA